MSGKSSKRRLSFDSDSSVDGISPGPSKPDTSRCPMNDDELLELLQNSDFEDNLSDGDFDLESEDEDEDVNGVYIVQPDSVVPVESPNPIPTNISTAFTSYNLPTGSPSRVIQLQNQQVWTPSPKNAPLIPFKGNTGMLQVPNSNEPIDFFFTYSRTIFLI